MALRLGGCWSFLTGNLKDCVKLKIKDFVGSVVAKGPFLKV